MSLFDIIAIAGGVVVLGGAVWYIINDGFPMSEVIGDGGPDQGPCTFTAEDTCPYHHPVFRGMNEGLRKCCFS